MVILWCCLLSRQELLRVRFYVFVQIDQIAWYTAASCLMRGKKVSPQLATKKRYVYLEASANATMIALANTKNKTERYPETEGTPRHTRIFSSLFLRDWNTPQQCQAACSSASFTCLFLTPHSYPFFLQFRLITSCHLHHRLRTAEAKQLRVSWCFLTWELSHSSEHSDCPLNPLQLVVYRSLFADTCICFWRIARSLSIVLNGSFLSEN